MANKVKMQFPAATTKTHQGGRKETAHIKGKTRILKTGKTDEFRPPGVVTILVTGLAVIAITTMIPARVT